MKKVLSIVVPPFRLYHCYAYPLAIILSNENTLEWFYCNYIHLFYIENQEIDPLRFYCPDYKGRFNNGFLPWLDYQVLDRDIIKNLNIDIIQLVKYSIDSEQYVSLYWDEYFVPNGLSQGSSHFWQRTLIYGYDDTSNVFNTYSEKSGGRLKTCLVSYDDFKLSFYGLEGEPWFKNIYLMKLDSNKQYEFDVKNVIKQISDYLSSRDVTESCRESFNPYIGVKFGFSIYDCIKNYLNTVPINNKHYHKTLNLLSEHKKIMLSRIKFMQDNGYLNISSSYYKNYEIVLKTTNILGDMFLKYNLLHDEEIIKRIITKINEISEMEKEILKELVNELSRQSLK